jgi:hypothetical protein
VVDERGALLTEGNPPLRCGGKAMIFQLDLPAIERLIGGDTEVEVRIRKQIVEEFARRHLKAIAETASYEAAIQAAKDYVNQAAKETFGIENLVTSHLWPTAGHRLKAMVESMVKEQAQKAVDEALLKTIEYQKRYWSKEINDAVRKANDKEIEKLVEAEIQRRLTAAKEAKS